MDKEIVLSGVISQEDLNGYIRRLPPKDPCVFMIERAVPLCGNELVCPYKGKDDYPHQGARRRECRREIVLRHKKILGV